MITIDGTQIKHLSYSAISTWHFCPRKWYLGYVKQLKEPTNVNYVFGTVMHRAIEKAAKIGGKAVDFYEEELKLELALNSLTEYDRITMLSLGMRLLSSGATQSILENIKPAAIEKFISFNVDGVPIPIIGFIDILQSNGIPLDIKTSRGDWSEEQAANETQPLFYLTALDANGMHSHEGNFEHLVVVKDEVSPRSYIIRTHFEDYDRIVRASVQDAWRGIEQRKWTEISPENHHPRCDCQRLLPWSETLN